VIVRARAGSSFGGVVVVELASRDDDNYSGLSDNYTTPRTR
jgi:hypothetical protein